MTDETTWQRLHRIADARRKFLGLTVAGIADAGGPSPAWFYNLKNVTGPPSVRHRPFLRELDEALQWPEGTSTGLLTKDRSEWVTEALEAEEYRLVHLQHRYATFGEAVTEHLFTLESAEAEALMRRIAQEMGFPVLGD